MQPKIVLPISILLIGLIIAWALIAIRPEPNQPASPAEAPAVQVIRVVPQTLTLNVRSQGVIIPRTEIDLIPEVAGRIIKLHPAFVTGDAFKAGDILVTIDPRDYDHAIMNAQAQVAAARHRLALEEAEAIQARHEWQTLGSKQSPTSLMLREPQLAEARAKLKAAEADLAQARLKRNRCEWRAPFAGRVREKLSGLGQFVQPGNVLARLYAIDVAEVRLPLAMDQLSYLDWPQKQPASGRRHSITLADGRPRVTLTSEFSGTRQQWMGRIVRIEGAFDEITGLLYAVAEINHLHAEKENKFPLLPGLFVQAEIEGREQSDLFVLPRDAVNANRTVLLIDEENRLRTRSVNVVRIETDYVLVRGSLATDDLVVAVANQSPVEGLKVRHEVIEPNLKLKQSGIAPPLSSRETP